MRAALLVAGFTTLAAVWLLPLGAILPGPFSAGMTRHMGVVAVATPLLALGLAGGRFDPVRRAPRLFRPIAASVVELLVVWAWHAPALHHSAAASTVVLTLEQASFLACGLLLWASAFGGGHRPPRPRSPRGGLGGARPPTARLGHGGPAPLTARGGLRRPVSTGRFGTAGSSTDAGPEPLAQRRAAGVVALLLTSMHMTLLGALLALPPRALYPSLGGAVPLGSSPGGPSPAGAAALLADQHLGGAIMLGVGGASYLAGGLALTLVLLRRGARRHPATRSLPPRHGAHPAAPGGPP